MECSSCGTELAAHETRCPVCGKPTVHFQRQRRCLHCGASVAERAKTCMMCGQPVDSLPLNTSFTGSWLGIGLGILIIVGLVIGVTRYQGGRSDTGQAALPVASTPTLTPTVTFTPGPTRTPSPTATQTPPPTATPRTHVVQSGENLSYLGQFYGVEVDDLIALNDIDDVRGLRVGQELVIPPPRGIAAGDEPHDLPPQIVYVIEAGDTLLDIALRHGTSIEAIVAVNPDLNLDLIYPGEEIVVPLSTPTPTPTPTATLTPTSTPGPPYSPPDLLSPPDGHTATGTALLFNWTATGPLADDEYYVLQLTWSNGSRYEHWTKSSGWRMSGEQRLAPGSFAWTVTIMRQTGADSDGSPVGVSVTGPGAQRTVEWPQ